MSLDVTLTYTCDGNDVEVFKANITNNLVRMADAADIYEHLWHPEIQGVDYAKQLVVPLKRGLRKMKARPEKYQLFNPKNGWGSYDVFIPWIEEYIKACEKYPNAIINTY